MPPRGELMYVLCQPPQFKTWLPNHEVGKMFLEYYVHDMTISLVHLYLETRYQGNVCLVPLYADIKDNVEKYFEDEFNYICCNLFDEAATTDELHPTWAETILSYFNHDSCLICDCAKETYLAYHEAMFYPVMHMIEACYKAGLTLVPNSYIDNTHSFSIILEVGKDEYVYSRFGDSMYVDTPFRSGNTPVRITGEIGQNVYGCRPPPIHPLAHPHTANISGHSGYGGGNDRLLGVPLLV